MSKNQAVTTHATAKNLIDSIVRSDQHLNLTYTMMILSSEDVPFLYVEICYDEENNLTHLSGDVEGVSFGV